MKQLTFLFGWLMLAGCMVGPDYHKPEVAVAAAYKEAGDWKTVEPKNDLPRGDWWKIYGDAELNALMPQVEISNQNVLAAVAQYRQALALLGVAQASYFPTVSGSMAGTRAQGTSPTTAGVTTVIPGSPVRNTARLSYSASWEADIWGHLGRNVESNQAAAQASNADLQAALLSAQGTLLQTYFQLRVDDAQLQLLNQTSAAYQRTLEITQNRFEAGVAGRVDVEQAVTQLKTTQAQAIDLTVQRSQLEHAIAVLIGKSPSDFQLKPNYALPVLPLIPAALPAALLERRPDIAGAERRMVAANAQIGVAQAAFFPALTFTSTGGYQNSSLSQLMTVPNRFWSLGPSLALTLFDAGARTAQKESARASYDKSVASYRQTVLAAFQEVEDNLVALHQLADEAVVQQAAAQSSAEALELTENQYQAGTVSYLNVVTAQATALGTRRSNLDIAGRRLLANAALVKALGGDWQKGEK